MGHRATLRRLGPCLALALACAPARPDLILIVLDTVRADRLSACGYERPTSPHLEQLAGRPDVAFTCFAEAPATWTIPSHASFLTGLSYPEHGAGIGGFRRPAPLSVELGTLPLQLTGYQTMLVSGNPLLGKAGLDRGFEVRRVAMDYGELYGQALAEALGAALAERDRSRPLFLLLNISDAHMPWAAVPTGHPWLPETPGLRSGGPERELRRRLYSGRLGAEERAAFLERRSRLYDHAVERADATLERTLGVLRRAGLLDNGYRLVVTSDHGERLGEDRVLGHGPYDLRESVTRVPLLFESDRDPRPSLTRPVAALEAYSLLLDGAPSGAPVVAAASLRSIAWWGPGEKLVWMTSKELVRYPGLEDGGPGEPAPEHPRRAELQRLAREMEGRWRSAQGRRDEEAERLGRELRALGYVDD
ncbi:MAG: sulfatase-like hydrolase/transferase [Thermoanaerobaculia bacterium]